MNGIQLYLQDLSCHNFCHSNNTTSQLSIEPEVTVLGHTSSSKEKHILPEHVMSAWNCGGEEIASDVFFEYPQFESLVEQMPPEPMNRKQTTGSK